MRTQLAGVWIGVGLLAGLAIARSSVFDRIENSYHSAMSHCYVNGEALMAMRVRIMSGAPKPANFDALVERGRIVCFVKEPEVTP